MSASLHTTRTVSIIMVVLVVVSLGRTFPTYAQDPPATAEHAAAATTHEPAILKAIIAAHWRLANAREALPPVQVVHEEKLETQDWIEYAYDGAALRLYVSPGPNGGDIFAILVDTREPQYKEFTQPAFAEHYAAYHHGSYVVVVPVHPVSQELFNTLKGRRWAEDELQKQLGAPSYHWHVHGVGWMGLTYVAQGLSFIGDPGPPGTTVMYQLHNQEAETEAGMNGAALPPIESVSHLDYATLQRQEREGFAQSLLGQREQIDKALADGKRSPDGQFVAGIVNIVGLRYMAEVAIQERGKPEQRYYPGATLQDVYWLNAHAIVLEVEIDAGDEFGWKTMDPLTGKTQDVAGGVHDHLATDFGVSGPDRFWYKTEDGEKHEVTVPSMNPPTKQ